MTSSDRTEPDVEPMRAAHRDASGQIDARPDPRVRAAVLAQATVAIAARQRRATSNPFRAGRWPLSMAAVLVVSVMTGLLVTRTIRDEPERVTPVAAVAPPVSPAVKDASPAKADDAPRPAQPIAQPAAQPAPAQPRAARPREASRPKTASSPSTGATTSTASAVAAPSSVEREPSRALSNGPTPWPGSSSPAATAPGAIVPAAPPAPATPASPRPAPPFAREQNAVPSPASAAPPATAASPRATSRDASSQSGGDRAKLSASALRRSVEEKSDSEPATPEAWVERIVELRDAGRAEEADRELAALRRRYPDFAIPQAALGSTGTR